MTTWMRGLLMFLVLGALGAAECTSKVNEYLATSGYKVTTMKPCSAYMIEGALDVPRNELKGVILVSEGEGNVVVGTVVRPKAVLDTSAPALLKLLQLSHRLDYVKIGIDRDGDLFVREERRLSVVDEAEFKKIFDDVITASKKVEAALR